MKIEILLTRLAIAVSALALALGFASLIYSVELGPDGLSIKKLSLVVVFCAALLSLFYGNVVYQLTRLGQIRRHFAHHHDAPGPARHSMRSRRLRGLGFSFPCTRNGFRS